MPFPFHFLKFSNMKPQQNFSYRNPIPSPNILTRVKTKKFPKSSFYLFRRFCATETSRPSLPSLRDHKKRASMVNSSVNLSFWEKKIEN